MLAVFRKKSLWSLVAGLTALAFLASGCATLPPQTTQVTYFPKCYEPIQILRNQEKDLQMAVAGGAVIGAVGGAVLGYLVTGKAQGALVGAGAGALAGGVAGYAMQKQKQIKDDNLRYASYRQDINKDTEKLDRTLIAARQAQQCYDQQFQSLVTLVKGKHITKAEAEKRFKEIQDGSAEVAQILGHISNQANDRAAQYNEALNTEAKKVGVTPEEIMAVSAPPPAAQPAAQAAAPAAASAAKPADKKAAKKAAKKTAKKAAQEPAATAAIPAAQPVSQATTPMNPKLQDKPELVAMGQSHGQFQDRKQQVDEAKTTAENTIKDNQKKFDVLFTGAGA
ncbi:MAG: glycine zipper domain-containing protein [Pseudomonadota bacterium]